VQTQDWTSQWLQQHVKAALMLIRQIMLHMSEALNPHLLKMWTQQGAVSDTHCLPKAVSGTTHQRQKP